MCKECSQSYAPSLVPQKHKIITSITHSVKGGFYTVCNRSNNLVIPRVLNNKALGSICLSTTFYKIPLEPVPWLAPLSFRDACA